MRHITYILLGMLFYFNIFTVTSQTSSKPNIIWIVCEDISPLLGTYGDPNVNTPNLDQLSREGIQYNKVYTTAGVCAPSRSSIITGMNQISIGTQHMRTTGDPKYYPKGLPSYSAVIPDYVKAFPEYLRMSGYYTSNNAKEDYQFEEPVTVWDESSAAASYVDRVKDQPFFSVFNVAITHEMFLMRKPDSLLYEPNRMNLPLFYEDTETLRKDQAILYTRIEQMDGEVGKIIQKLKKDGVYDDSYVFFFSDHGGNLPWTKRELLERGTHIPLIVKLPQGQNQGTYNKDLISSIDFAPTVLSIAGIEPPEYMQGKAFLGDFKAKEKNNYVFAARDRMDDQYDRVRSVSDGTFRYVYNFMPEKPKFQDIKFRNGIDSMKEILEMREQGKITNPFLLDWFKTPKAVEELYYTAKDPDEVHNLANNLAYQEKLQSLKKVLFDWMEEVGDMSEREEKDMVVNLWWNGKGKPMQTSKPKVIKDKDGIRIQCDTKGASIGYRIVNGSVKDSISKPMKTWDFPKYFSQPEDQKITVPYSWNVYNGQTIDLDKGDEIIIQAQRIGYLPSTTSYHEGI